MQYNSLCILFNWKTAGNRSYKANIEKSRYHNFILLFVIKSNILIIKKIKFGYYLKNFSHIIN